MGTQLQFDDLYTISHTDDPNTSHDAAASLGHSRETMAMRLLHVYSLRPLTAEEASAMCGYTAWAGRKRVTDLKNAHLLAPLVDGDVIVTRVGASGRRAQVLAITPAGLQAMRTGRL